MSLPTQRQLIDDLKAFGLTKRAIARHLGTTAAYLAHIYSGKRTFRHQTYEKLYALREKCCGDTTLTSADDS